MFCPNCGTKIPEDCSFCPNCGTKVEQAAVPVQAAAAASEGQAANRAAPTVTSTMPAGVPTAKKSPVKWLPVAAVVLVIVLLAVLIRVLFGRSSIEGQFVYAGNGNYYLLKDLDGTPMEFSSARDMENYWGLVKFSEDGKYVYYFSKVDDVDTVGTLCRAQISKIKNRDDNSAASEIVDSNVRTYSYSVVNNTDVIYCDGEDNLKYYHNGETVRIAREVQNFYLSEDSTRLVYLASAEDDSTQRTMYGVTLSSPENVVKLVDNVDYVQDATNLDHVVYTVLDDDTGEQSLYVVDFTGNAEKIAGRVTWSYSEDGEVYYAAANGSKLNLYDYVNDPDAAQDASLTEPDVDNYEIPYYRYYQLDTDDDPNAYAELYTSCTNGLERFGYGWDSMEDVVDDDYYTTATRDAVRSFIEKYGASADKNGYILVTDEIRNDLKAINGTLEDATDSEWISLCYRKEQSGTTTDYDKYQEDLNAYNEAQNRISMRERLQSPDEQRDVLALHVYKTADNTNTLLMDNLAVVSQMGNSLLAYRPIDQIADKIDLKDVASTYDVVDMINSMESGTVPVYNYKTAQTAFTMDAETYQEAGSLYVMGSNVVMINDDSELLTAPISNGTVGSFSLMAEDVRVDGYNQDKNCLYYYANVYESSGHEYGDYYCYTNGASTRLVRDAQTYGVTVYEDGTILSGTYQSQTDNFMTVYEMDIINAKGESTFLSDGLTQIFYLGDNMFVYVAEDDLFLYDGKERERLQEGVECLWYNGELEPVVNSEYYYSEY